MTLPDDPGLGRRPFRLFGPKALRMVPAIGHAAVLFTLSAQPDLTFAEDPSLDLVVRKLGHATAYALLAVLVLWGLGGVGDRRRRLVVLGAVAAYAVSDEIHQAFVPGRGASAVDVAIDTLGGAVGLLLAPRMLQAPAVPSRRAADGYAAAPRGPRPDRAP